MAVGRPTYPPTNSFKVEGLDEEFQVNDGRFEIRIPFAVNVPPSQQVSQRLAGLLLEEMGEGGEERRRRPAPLSQPRGAGQWLRPLGADEYEDPSHRSALGNPGEVGVIGPRKR